MLTVLTDQNAGGSLAGLLFLETNTRPDAAGFHIQYCLNYTQFILAVVFLFKFFCHHQRMFQ